MNKAIAIIIIGVNPASIKHSRPCFEAFPEIQFELPINKIIKEPTIAMILKFFFISYPQRPIAK